MIYPKVSIIIPCYNHSQFILETLESVLSQTFKDFECIIVDDGSTDHTKENVLSWIKIDKRFKYYYQNNSGLSKARNKGISLSTGSYILPLDSDDKISNNYLEKCVVVLNSRRDVKIVYGEAYFFGNSNKKWNLAKYDFDDILYKNMIYCTALFRKEDWERVDGYDENLKEGLEDWEFWIHILKKGGEVVKLNDCFFYYRLKNSSMITDSVINNSYGYNSRLYIFEKHIDAYRKTNFYDMYFENYRLNKKVKKPLSFLSITDLFVLLIAAIYKKINYLLIRIYKFLLK